VATLNVLLSVASLLSHTQVYREALAAFPRKSAESLVAAIVILNVVSPSKLAGELELFGHKVWKALDVSEVLFLCEQHHVDAVVIAAEVDAGELIQKQWRGTVMRLKPNPDAAYLDWELSEVFPKKGSTIQ
jgi:hypothetical protein